MTDRQSPELNDQDLDEVTGGLLPAVAPASSIIAVAPAAASPQPASPAAQRGLIGLL